MSSAAISRACGSQRHRVERRTRTRPRAASTSRGYISLPRRAHTSLVAAISHNHDGGPSENLSRVADEGSRLLSCVFVCLVPAKKTGEIARLSIVLAKLSRSLYLWYLWRTVFDEIFRPPEKESFFPSCTCLRDVSSPQASDHIVGDRTLVMVTMRGCL